MNKELNEELRKNVDNLIADGILDNKKIFLFGMNSPGDYVIQLLKDKGGNVYGVLDNNVNNQGKSMLGVRVYSPDYLMNMETEEVCVLICSKYYPEMRTQLEKMGLLVDKHIFCILNMSVEVKVQENYLEEIEEQFYSYLETYNRLTAGRDKDFIYILAYKANGDVYIAASLVEQLKKKSKNIILILGGSVCERIAGMFNVNQVLRVTSDEYNAIYNLVRVLGFEITRTCIVQPEAHHYNIFTSVYGYKGLNFMDLIARAVFDLNPQYNIMNPDSVWLTNEESMMLGKKAVIISPYANSLPSCTIEFWEKLVDGLKQREYTVYTNSCGEAEPPVRGTEALFLPIDKMRDMMKGCGAFIAIRSGLCDVIATALCKKIIIYPDKGMGFGTVKDYFSLNEMGLCDDANEIVYNEDKENEVMKEIWNIIDNNGGIGE